MNKIWGSNISRGNYSWQLPCLHVHTELSDTLNLKSKFRHLLVGDYEQIILPLYALVSSSVKMRNEENLPLKAVVKLNERKPGAR